MAKPCVITKSSTSAEPILHEWRSHEWGIGLARVDDLGSKAWLQNAWSTFLQCGWGNFALFLHCSNFYTWWTKTLKFGTKLALLNINLGLDFSFDQLSHCKMTNVKRHVPTFSLSSLPAISIGFFPLKVALAELVEIFSWKFPETFISASSWSQKNIKV